MANESQCKTCKMYEADTIFCNKKFMFLSFDETACKDCEPAETMANEAAPDGSAPDTANEQDSKNQKIAEIISALYVDKIRKSKQKLKRTPVKLEEIPESEKPKSKTIYKILLGCLILIVLVFKMCIKNPELFGLGKSAWYSVKAAKLTQEVADEPYERRMYVYKHEISPLLNKALAANSKLWTAWFLKGVWMVDAQQFDSACICLSKTLKCMEETDGVEPDKEATCKYLYAMCLRLNGQLDEALDYAHECTLLTPDNKDIRDELQQCIRQKCDSIIADEPRSPASPDTRPQQLIEFSRSMRNDNLWHEALYIAKRGRKDFAHVPEIKKEVKDCYLAYSDYLLANSEDTQTMWETSSVIWNADRKRALNLRRKCAKLGAPEAQKWFRKKGYEWD